MTSLLLPIAFYQYQFPHFCIYILRKQLFHLPNRNMLLTMDINVNLCTFRVHAREVVDKLNFNTELGGNSTTIKIKNALLMINALNCSYIYFFFMISYGSSETVRREVFPEEVCSFCVYIFFLKDEHSHNYLFLVCSFYCTLTCTL